MKVKKLIIFLVVVVGLLTVGLTTYYFVRNNERISIEVEQIYCNTGDEISLSSLGIKVKNQNTGKKTQFNYNAGGEKVTNLIRYDASKKAYVVNGEQGGVVEVVISTTNKKCSKLKFKVFIGDGSIDDPYYIQNQNDLKNMGVEYDLNKSFMLLSDIELNEEFKPIGFDESLNESLIFQGHFNGNNKTIRNMNVAGDYYNAGLFGKIGTSGVVENLKIAEASVSGGNAFVGVVAGTIQGTVKNVEVQSAKISTSVNSYALGGFAGVVSGNVELSSVSNAKIELDSVSGVVGGFAGMQDKATVIASYANNVEIVGTNSQSTSGGFVGKLQIGSNSGKILQSYANTKSNLTSFGGFIGEIVESEDFNSSTDKMLSHLVGNFAIMENFDSSSAILDENLVASFNKNYFVNPQNPDGRIFFDETYALYMIRGFANSEEINSKNLVYYAFSTNTKILWDLRIVWSLEDGGLPVLKEDALKPMQPPQKYNERVLTDKVSDSTESFMSVLSGDVNGETINLTDDIDLSKVYWKPVELTNTTINGNGNTITFDVNVSVGAYAGLFTIIENCKISNLHIKIVGNIVSSVTYFGALCSVARNSEINGVAVEYCGATFNYANITNFGGLIGNTDSGCVIKNSRVVKLNNLHMGTIYNAGVLVGINYGEIYRCNVDGVITALESVGGVVGRNYGYIHTVETADGDSVTINYNNNFNLANVGGVAGINNSTISDCKIKAKINILNCETKVLVGGVAGTNDGTISYVELSGEGVEVADVSGIIMVGGTVGQNNSQGSIEGVINKMSSLGTYNKGRTQYVGGAVGQNYGTVKQIVVRPNMSGNYVSGIVAIMSSGLIDQIAVGKAKYNMIRKETTFTDNIIEGDKYLAGVSVQFNSGIISNVQTKTTLTGKLDSTRSSLIALIFPNAAKFTNAAIDNSFAGKGIRYQETWSDYKDCSDGAEFGFGKTTILFNIYMDNSTHGCMQNVVINENNSGVKQAIKSQSIAFWWLGSLTLEYDENSSVSSYVKLTSDFYNANQFVGEFSFVVATYQAMFVQNDHYITKTLNFNFNSIWQAKDGANLVFVTPLFMYLD